MYIDTYTQPNELTSKLFGLRFSLAATEHQFLAWRQEENLPFIRLGIAVNIISWLVGLPLLYLWNEKLFQYLLVIVSGLLLLSLTAGLFASFHQFAKKWMVHIAIALFLLNSLAVFYVFYELGHSAGSMVIWYVFGMLFCPFMRMPPIAAFIAVMPFTVWIILTQSQKSNADLSRIDAFSFMLAPFLTLFVIIIVCVILDRMTRLEFAMDQIISRQTNELKRNGELIRRYIPRSVAEHIEAGNGAAVDAPKRKQVTILFSDIVGFTRLADQIDAESLTDILATYMSTMVKLVEAHGGTLNEFAGDGLMSIFGAPSQMLLKDQALQAIKTAQAMQKALSVLNDKWSRLGLAKELPLCIRIGINTGELSVGSFGSEGRMTYTAIGLQTNVAARIQAQCKPGSVLLSDSTWHLVKDDVPCEPMGKLAIKGVQFLVPVYEPSHT